MKNAISKFKLIDGLRIGHWTHADAGTGCTVFLFERGAVVGVDVRGSASGTRELDACRPEHLTEKIHGICLAGGSAFGLDAAGGAMQYLEEHGIGFETVVARVPVVASAILFDLAYRDSQTRPRREEGYQAALAAQNDQLQQGSVGVGTGATVGKLFGVHSASKGGFGAAAATAPALHANKHVSIQAFAAVNAFGDIVNPRTGKIIAGAHALPRSKKFADTMKQMKRGVLRHAFGVPARTNTTIAVVATSAAFTKIEMQKIAQMAQNGIARAIRPAHTIFDGDVVFAVSCPPEKNPRKADLNLIGEVAAETLTLAILNAVKFA